MWRGACGVESLMGRRTGIIMSFVPPSFDLGSAVNLKKRTQMIKLYVKTTVILSDLLLQSHSSLAVVSTGF